jgi:hypothetical protein
MVYGGGVLGASHRLRHRDTLTVVMSHRVTVGSPAGTNAEPDFCVAPPLCADRRLSACLRFFRRHYTVIGLDQLREGLLGGTALPPRSLLVTFDDGWKDTVSVALPIMRSQGIPATVFVAADVLAETTSWWWREILLRALRTDAQLGSAMGLGRWRAFVVGRIRIGVAGTLWRPRSAAARALAPAIILLTSDPSPNAASAGRPGSCSAALR